MTPEEYKRLIDYQNGSYTLFDANASGDVYAVVKRLYPAPDFLREYVSMARALREAISACELEQGPCWVVARSSLGPVRQRCGRGACDVRPVAWVTRDGVAKVLPGGEILPFWRRIFRVMPIDNRLARTPTMLYTAAVRAAMRIASHEGKPRIVGGDTQNGTIPLVYVQPGGVVRRYDQARGPENVVERMDRYEVAQQFAASRGASLLPMGV